MELSIIIVNYNVKYFLEQCLRSVEKAMQHIEAEVFVVDNNSSDGSVAMVQQKFPHVHCIANTVNIGFSKANNQAIRISKGKYVLLLNPDTIVAEDTFQKCIAFMNTHEDAGAIGIKMIDGTGTFLPESKRALPTPWVSLCKISGLSSLFPHSEKFARYHLGYLDKNQNHKVDVLSGAYMFMRKAALEKCGLLDEDFFMYGEDIDLSYRITTSGYANYYVAESSILHYKGESTKKGSLNYVKTFYEAMILFARKHYSSGNAGIYSSVIQIAIILKAIQTALFNGLKTIGIPLFDFMFSLIGMYVCKELWENKIMHDDHYYKTIFIVVFMPLYVLVWMLCSFFAGAYDKPIRSINILKGLGIGTLLLTAIYGLLPEEFRYSRALIIISAVWVTVVFYINRIFFSGISKNSVVFETSDELKIAIIGEPDEAQRVLTLLNQSGVQFYYVGCIKPGSTLESGYIGTTSQLESLCRSFSIKELVFCSKNISYKDTLRLMESIQGQVQIKIVPEYSNSIIGSNSKDTAGDLYAPDTNLKIGSSTQRRNKRLFDIISACILIGIWPISIAMCKRKWKMIPSMFEVLWGNKTWIAYTQTETETRFQLPQLKRSVTDNSLYPLASETVELYNLQYAREYSVAIDIKLLYNKWKNL